MSLGVLARATKAVTAHVKELKGKSNNNKVENGRLKNDNSPPSTDSACVIVDSTTNTTYVRGKVLGKVRRFFFFYLSSFFSFFFFFFFFF